MTVKTEIDSFDDLLQVARGRKEPQRLLFVFAGTELPDEATPEQRERFADLRIFRRQLAAQDETGFIRREELFVIGQND